MKTYYFFLIILLSSTLALSQDVISISGTVTDKYDNPLSDVLISINWNKIGRLSTYDGTFHLSVRLSDTIVFNHLSFETKAIAVSKLKKPKALVVQMTERSIELAEVEINNWGTWDDFKTNIKTMNSDSIRKTDYYRLETMFGSKKRHPIKNPYFRKLEIPEMNLSTLLNPYKTLTTLPRYVYTKLSKNQHYRRKIESEELKGLSVIKNRHRYNEAYLGKILNIEGNELRSFKIYCDYFVHLEQNDYEVIKQIKAIYMDWLNMKKKSNNSIPILPIKTQN